MNLNTSSKRYKWIMEDLMSHEVEIRLVKYIIDNKYVVIGENNQKMTVTGKEYGYKTASVDLLAGHTCPAASLCFSRVMKDQNGKRTIEDLGKFRCYATKSEVQYTAVYDLHAKNKVLADSDMFVYVLTYILRASKKTLVRFHSSGDFYDFEYFKKWYEVIRINPSITFFGYTKQATFYKWYLENSLPNMKMVYSFGGKLDSYALKNNLPSCTVVTDDYLYNAHNTTIESLGDGLYRYTYIVGKNKDGSDETVIHESNLLLEYGTYYNPIKKCVENLSCLHDSKKSSVDDFERIMRQESFGIIFH